MFNEILLYFWRVISTTVLSFLLVFGLPLSLGFIQNFISKVNSQMGYRIMGRTAFQWLFARLGVPVHEAGHAVFAIIFRHKITDIKLFKADTGDGCLGYVKHTYNKKSLYQRTGNFFIGIGPVLFGSLVLFIISKLMFSYQMPHVSAGLENLWGNVLAIFSGTLALLSAIFDSGSVLKPIIFLYLVFAIGSNITLSPADLNGAKTGFWVLMGILFGVNFLTLWLFEIVPTVLAAVAGVTAYMSLILGVSILLNLIFTAILYFFKGIMNR